MIKLIASKCFLDYRLKDRRNFGGVKIWGIQLFLVWTPKFKHIFLNIMWVTKKNYTRARHSLSGVARARIIFLVTHMIFKKIFLNFGVHTSKSWNPQILTPQKFLQSLSLKLKKNFGAISFIIFSSGFNYGTSTIIINYRKKVPPPLWKWTVRLTDISVAW